MKGNKNMNITKYTNKEIGELGEKLAQKFLESDGYKIICQNFKAIQGEIDIIARDKYGIIIFVEVKTRTSLNFGKPAEAVNKNKLEHIIKTARYYLHINQIEDNTMRFDIIEVFIYKGRYKINHIKQIM